MEFYLHFFFLKAYRLANDRRQQKAYLDRKCKNWHGKTALVITAIVSRLTCGKCIFHFFFSDSDMLCQASASPICTSRHAPSERRRLLCAAHARASQHWRVVAREITLYDCTVHSRRSSLGCTGKLYSAVPGSDLQALLNNNSRLALELMRFAAGRPLTGQLNFNST